MNKQKYLKYKAKNDIILNSIKRKFSQLGGKLDRVDIIISSISIHNNLFDTNDEVDKIIIYLNENFNFMTFFINKYTCRQVKQYISDTKINDVASGETLYIINEILKNDDDMVYYLSDFYTFNDESVIDNENLINEAKLSTNISMYEKSKILQKEKTNELLLNDIKGIPTVVLKMLINYYIDASPNKKIIFCCEPILGTRENSISYKNFDKTPEKRYDDLIKYYKNIGLIHNVDVFMILHLYMTSYGYKSDIDKESDLKRRKQTNLQFPHRKYYEKRNFMMGELEKKFEKENINAHHGCKFYIKTCKEIEQ